jgi:hypothetical protein
MVKPSQFILTTDYATLKNDDADSTSVTAPGAQVVPAAVGPLGGYLEYHTDLEVGVQGSITRLQISSSKQSNIVYSTRTLSLDRTGTVLGMPAIYSVVAFTYRVGPTTLRCQVYIQNPNADPLTTEAGNETFTFYVNTFIPPYA